MNFDHFFFKDFCELSKQITIKIFVSSYIQDYGNRIDFEVSALSINTF